ncbi:Protein of unknown function [Amycolatopsis arida]|uniref:DUF3558 domain-containing protein n=1 Tax=Amycolatopsis arida TaxID=587909 RepID=A0A1I5VHJ3_9PSEU|nr:DUF3558 family protein [Amycolatopsis arida]TDX87888.1 uncharacterized protein DUF3558 [Amycolatopsis arida]SFQ06960.1 Protein of unknown function [Amycolatopsis arida]
MALSTRGTRSTRRTLSTRNTARTAGGGRRGVVAALLGAGAAMLLVGCGATLPGSAAPRADSGEGPAGTAPATPAGLADLRPCTLLGPTERSTAGLTSPGQEITIGVARGCDWAETGTFGVTITVDTTSGLADLAVRRAHTTEDTVGDRAALRVADPKADDGTCAVLLAAGDGASVHVDVTNADFTDTASACRRASTIAELIGPKLPT